MENSKIGLAALALVVAASGCVQNASVSTEDLSYTAPGTYTLEAEGSFDGGRNYTFTGALGLSAIEVTVMELNISEKEFYNQSGALLGLLSGDYDANSSKKQIRGRKWTVMNGSLDAGGVKGRVYMFTSFHRGKAYIFKLVEVREQGGESYSVDRYGEFRKSVLSAEFR